MKHLFLIICMSLFISNTLADTASKSNQILNKIHSKIEKKYPAVKHIKAADFLDLDAEKTLIFDVRKKDEYTVSHLAKAIQIDPDIQAEDFLENYAQAVQNKTVVFYCSVGERSSLLASQLTESILTMGGKASFNLSGGLFSWHNEKHELMHKNAKTNLIHPYNAYWGRLIDDKQAISYEPEKTSQKQE